MQVIFHNDGVVAGVSEAESYAEEMLARALKGYVNGLTRVEIWVRDENGPKGGPDHIACTMEARIEHLKPEVVTHHAPSVKEAIRGAADKLYKVLDTLFHKHEDYRRKRRG